LASFTSAHDLVGVSDHGGAIKTLVEGIAHESVWRRVVATQTCVDVSNKLATVGMGMHRCRTPDATCLYSSPSTMVNDLLREKLALVTGVDHLW
jgi:hypothetical protein